VFAVVKLGRGNQQRNSSPTKTFRDYNGSPPLLFEKVVGGWDSPNLEVIPVTSEPEGRGFESHPRNRFLGPRLGWHSLKTVRNGCFYFDFLV